MLWECCSCDRRRESAVRYGEDWDGRPLAIGPDCPGCGLEMIPAEGGDPGRPAPDTETLERGG